MSRQVRPAYGSMTTNAIAPLCVDTAGNVCAAPGQDWFRRVAAGEVPGYTLIRKFGHNPEVGAVEEMVWSNGGAYTGWLTAASAVRARSGGNVNDTAAGTGARTLTIEGLDETWAAATETVTLAGASASAATSTTFIRVHRAYVATCGAYTAANTGGIVIETTGGTAVAAIEATRGQTTLAAYTIPAGTTGWLFDVSATSSQRSNRQADIYVYERRDADTVAAPFPPRRLMGRLGGVGGLVTWDGVAGVHLPARTDVWVDAKRSDNGDSAVTIRFAILLRDDT